MHELASLASMQFPGRAGDLQAARRFDDLATELGRDYLKYHQFLADQFATVDPNPDPETYRKRYGSDAFTRYTADVSRYQELLRAEDLLRRARFAVEHEVKYEDPAYEGEGRHRKASPVGPGGELRPLDAKPDALLPPAEKPAPMPASFRPPWLDLPY